MKKTPVYIFILAFLLLQYACLSDKTSTSQSQAAEKIAVPEFSILSKELEKGIGKASFDILLANKVTEAELEQIAENIKNSNPGYEKYFIGYYLPDMPVEGAAWATSHYNPTLLINIQGISQEDEDNLKNPDLPEGEIIGKWFDNRPYVENTMIIYQSNGTYKLRQIYKDGSFGDKELQKQGDKFTYENDFGEFLKIESSGKLGYYSENERFALIDKVE